MSTLAIERSWGQPNRHTFLIAPIKKILAEELTEGTWLDPFSGFNSPATITNDINPEAPAMFHEDALVWLKGQSSEGVDGILYDPPYSFYQAKTVYENFGSDKMSMNMGYWAACKDEIARIIKPGGKVLCFGWNSMGISKGRGFEMVRIILIPHGGSRNDTIVTIERKLLGAR